MSETCVFVRNVRCLTPASRCTGFQPLHWLPAAAPYTPRLVCSTLFICIAPYSLLALKKEANLHRRSPCLARNHILPIWLTTNAELCSIDRPAFLMSDRTTISHLCFVNMCEAVQYYAHIAKSLLLLTSTRVSYTCSPVIRLKKFGPCRSEICKGRIF